MKKIVKIWTDLLECAWEKTKKKIKIAQIQKKIVKIWTDLLECAWEKTKKKNKIAQIHMN